MRQGPDRQQAAVRLGDRVDLSAAKVLRARDTMAIERGEARLATVKKAIIDPLRVCIDDVADEDVLCRLVGGAVAV